MLAPRRFRAAESLLQPGNLPFQTMDPLLVLRDGGIEGAVLALELGDPRDGEAMVVVKGPLSKGGRDKCDRISDGRCLGGA